MVSNVVFLMSVNHSESIKSFCQNRNVSEETDKLIEQNRKSEKPGLSDEGHVDKLLSEGQYKKVMVALWSEKNRARSLTWLQRHEPELHVPLLYEQAIAEFVVNPSIETIRDKTIPLLKIAKMRFVQDAICIDGKSAKDFEADMTSIYEITLLEAGKEYLPDVKLLDVKADANIASKKVINALSRTIEIIGTLPSPEWIASSDLHKELKKNTGFFDSRWNGKRIFFAQEMIKKIGSNF